MTSARVETAQDAARRLAGVNKVEALHVYRGADGKVIYWRIRARQGNGEKWIRPMRLNGHGYELGEPEFLGGKKPLYKLDHIAANPTAPIWVCEGEKPVGALTNIGAIATTSGGAQSAAAADWTPLREREVRLWADNDEAGKAYMGDVAAILQGLGCKLSAVDVDALGLPPKGDAWDWAHAHPNATLADVEALKRTPAHQAVADVQSPQATASSATAADSDLRVLTLAELVSYEFPEREPILEPWLLTQSLSMIHSWRGIGKTHVALGIAWAVATAGRFLTWGAPRPRRVLYVDGELPGAVLQKRLMALIEADERDFDPTYLRIVTPDAQGEGAMPDLATLEGQAAIEGAAADAELIILDNISTLCRGTGPENDAESWRVPQEWALRMRRAEKAVLFIHHSGKGGAQRGSSKREDTLDVVINLKRPPDYSEEQGARFELRYEKYRNGAGDEAKAIEAALSHDERGRVVWTHRSLEEGTFERVVELANDGLKPGEIVVELGIHKSRVSRHLKRARELGLVRGGSDHGK